MKADAIRRLQAEIERARANIESLELIPDEDTMPVGTMVRIRVTPRRSHDREQRTYLLHKVSGGDAAAESMWEFTGRLWGLGTLKTVNETGWISWEGLNRWAIDDVQIDSWELLGPTVPPLRVVDIEPDPTTGRQA